MTHDIDALQRLTQAVQTFETEAAEFQQNLEIFREIAEQNFAIECELSETRAQVGDARQELQNLKKKKSADSLNTSGRF